MKMCLFFFLTGRLSFAQELVGLWIEKSYHLTATYNYNEPALLRVLNRITNAEPISITKLSILCISITAPRLKTLSIMSLSEVTLSITTLSAMSVRITTVRIIKLTITELSLTTPRIMKVRITTLRITIKIPHSAK